MESIWTALMGNEVRQTFYQAGSVKTRVLEAGTGVPLILLHGAGGHAEAYSRNIVEHAKHFHVYAIDMVGHGFSGRPNIAYELDDFANFLRDFLDAIGAGTAILSGESLGAMVSIRFTHRFPERVRKLVLNTGILGPRDEKGREEIRDALERSRKAAGAPTRESVRKRLEWLMYEPEKMVTEELVDIRYKIYSQPEFGATLRKISDVVFGAGLQERPSAAWDPEQMRSIKCPVLVLWSRHNPGRSVEVARESAKIISNHRMVVLEHSAHWPQWEEVEQFNHAHLEFLRA
ncbi:MAG: alpha/beta hydrolase [Candidatus Binataceae bacterium]|nr:alpha/beta hydrolase [Candidatus Binataceae bacterium]